MRVTEFVKYFNHAIPKSPEISGWESVKINECGEKLVPISKLTNNIVVASQYYLKRIEGTLKECYIRESVGELLERASQGLPTGYKFVVWDAWRPLKLQKTLFDNFLEKLKQE